MVLGEQEARDKKKGIETMISENENKRKNKKNRTGKQVQVSVKSLQIRAVCKKIAKDRVHKDYLRPQGQLEDEKFVVTALALKITGLGL